MTNQQLADLEAIKQLKARYFRFLDTKQWDKFAEVFAEDMVSKNPADDPSKWSKGRPAFLERVRQIVRDGATVHHGHMPEIELTSATTAKGVWSMFDFVDHGATGWKGYGHYHEEYVKVNGQWKIQAFTLTRLRMDRWTRE